MASRNKIKLAASIEAAFKENGVDECSVDPDQIESAQGFWRRADCYSWEVYARTKQDGVNIGVFVGSYFTIAECAKAKSLNLTIERTWWAEAYPAP